MILLAKRVNRLRLNRSFSHITCYSLSARILSWKAGETTE